MSKAKPNFDKLNGCKILITGAAGYIGRELCRQLYKYDVSVTGVRKQNKSDEQDLDNWFYGDLSNLQFTKRVILETKPDYIFHLAGLASGNMDHSFVEKTLSSNVVATIQLFRACLNREINRIILSGSLEEPPQIIAEDYKISTPYAASKWAASVYGELYNRVYDLPVVVNRIFMVYGPGYQNKNRLLPTLMHNLIKGTPVHIRNGDRLVDWIYIDDVVDGLIHTALDEDKIWKKIDLGTGVLTTVEQFCKKVEELSGINGNIYYNINENKTNFQSEPRANIDKTREVLDWAPETALDEGLKKTVDWYLNKFKLGENV